MRIHPKRKAQLKWQILTLLGSAGILLLITAAIQHRRNAPIASLRVLQLNNEEEHRFIEEDDVRQILFQKFGHYVEGQPASQVPIAEIEAALEQSLFVRQAAIYVDAWQRLNISIEQRKPLLRVMDLRDESYYLDKDGIRIPVSTKYTARALVATGDIGAFMENFDEVEDSRLRKVFALAKYIEADPFLRHQIDQIHVQPSGFTVLIPKLGDHQIYFGSPDEEVEDKFERLKIFYREGLPYEGWNKYKEVNLAYRGQIVARKR